MKKIFAVAFALIALVGANALYINAKTTNAEVAPVTSDVTVHVAGNDDGDGGLPRAIGSIIGSLKAHVGAPRKYVQSAAPQRATQNF